MWERKREWKRERTGQHDHVENDEKWESVCAPVSEKEIHNAKTLNAAILIRAVVQYLGYSSWIKWSGQGDWV